MKNSISVPYPTYLDLLSICKLGLNKDDSAGHSKGQERRDWVKITILKSGQGMTLPAQFGQLKLEAVEMRLFQIL